MRRFVCLLAVMLLCLSLACPAFAAEDTFVPSITYKDGPEIEDAEMNEEDVKSCLVVSSLKDAEEKSTDISQEARDLLWDIYEELEEGSMKLPVEGEDLVVRELVDVSFMLKPCVESDHTHAEDLNKEGITITVDFNLGVSSNTDVYVFSYHNGQWDPAISVENKGNGVVTIVLEHLCPVAFCIEAGAETPPSQTGDEDAGSLIWWIVMMAVAIVAIVVLVINRKKFSK